MDLYLHINNKSQHGGTGFCPKDKGRQKEKQAGKFRLCVVFWEKTVYNKKNVKNKFLWGFAMLKIERQSIIEQEINKQGFVLVPELSELFRCSEETVRRDLKEMEGDGKLIRTHGGAYLIEKYDKSYPTNLRKSYFHRTKERMAQLALAHIHENDVVMMDSSTTCMALAEAIAYSQKTLTIITNSLQIATLCENKNTNINLICTGGTFRKRTSSYADQLTVDMIRGFRADCAFISCPKLTVEYGLSDNHRSEARVREWMLKQSRFKAVLADHTKFDESANILFSGLEDLDLLITDQKLDPAWESFAAANNISLEYSGE